MKILHFLLVLFVLAACSKEQRRSNKIDGDWKATVFFGESPKAGDEYAFSFIKDKKGEGEGLLKITEDGATEAYSIKYFFSQKDKLTMIIDEDAYVFDIQDFDKKKITMSDNYGYVMILER